jgi:hypothetical protein
MKPAQMLAHWRCGLLGATLLAGALPVGALTIVDLQPWRQSEEVPLRDAAGRGGRLVLTQLNPAANAWMLLTMQSPGGRSSVAYHLENADPAGQRIALDAGVPGRLRITGSSGSASCVLWPGTDLERAARLKLPYAPLCDARLYLRNAVPGNRSTLEATTEFLRDHVWGGERIVGFVKREFYRDAFVERAASVPPPPPERGGPAGAPPPARLQAGVAPRAMLAEGLGIDLGPAGRTVEPGRWYAAAGLDAVFVSVARPGELAAPAGRPVGLDAVESDALAYFVAFDLSAFDLGYELGTEHPRLGWSARVRPEVRDDRLPGPDGIDSAAPLVRSGMLAPPLLGRVVATFTGGFKREHGAFHSGALSAVNRGSHYGFIEQGVVFSALQPGLATLLVFNDGRVEMKTWSRDDETRLATVRHARQNGVPLLEPGVGGAAPVFGALVDHWGAGNWSGSDDERLRTLRAGACLIENEGHRFLVYGYFSSATPRAMAHVFHAYDCRYAMHLDMNALEHTYLALYPGSGAQRGVEHLVPGMAVLDKSAGATLLPRFLDFADDRDFFYLLARKGHQ